MEGYVIRKKKVTRKDVDLTPQIIKELQKLADQDKRKLKPYMEKVLEDHVYSKIGPPYLKTIDEAIKGLKK